MQHLPILKICSCPCQAGPKSGGLFLLSAKSCHIFTLSPHLLSRRVGPLERSQLWQVLEQYKCKRPACETPPGWRSPPAAVWAGRESLRGRPRRRSVPSARLQGYVPDTLESAQSPLPQARVIPIESLCWKGAV